MRLAATIATMRSVLRLPIRLIQQWLATQHQVRLSVGAITGPLQRLATHRQPVADQILARIRASPAVFADETGWRENGRNGYIWEMGTPQGERYDERHATCQGAVIKTMLGEEFTEVLTTDFYAGYNDTPGGRHQRCWVHLLRDLHALKAAHPHHAEVQTWAAALRAAYDQATAVRDHGGSERQGQRQQGETPLWRLGQQYGDQVGHPCQTLVRRRLRHYGEWLVFLTADGVAPDNHAAESGAPCSSSPARSAAAPVRKWAVTPIWC